MGGDAEKDLGVVLSYLTGRKLTLDEVLAAVDMSRSTYYDRQSKGTLTTTDTLLVAATNLGLNPVDLLIRYGRIDHSDVTDYIEYSAPARAAGSIASLPAKTIAARTAKISNLRPRNDAPPL